MFSFPRYWRGQGLAMTPARRRDRGSRGRDAGGGGRGASQRVARGPAQASGPAALEAAFRGARGQLSLGAPLNERCWPKAAVCCESDRDRFKRPRRLRRLGEGHQARVERGRAWPARPFATPVSVGYRWPGDLVLTYSQVLAACRAGETIEAQKNAPLGGRASGHDYS